MTRFVERRALAGSVAVAAAIGLVSVGSSCGGEDECEFNAVTRRIGGVGLTDCGLASFDDPGAVDDCAVDAYRAGQTFRAIYEQEDESLEAVVHAAGGAYHLVRLSSDGDITSAECEGGVFVEEGGRSYIACDEPGEFEPACE